MSDRPFIAPGPFARIIAIQLLANSRYELQIVRDDGVEITPGLPDEITVALYSPGGQLIFSGNSRHTPGSQALEYGEGVGGVVVGFQYQSGYYQIDLDADLLEAHYAMSSGDVSCHLQISGAKTLDTSYNRAYHPAALVTELAPGRFTISIPYWQVTTHSEQPTLNRVEQTTTIFSSVPYKAALAISDGQALANFTFPILGISWIPLPDLSGWGGTFDIREVCLGVSFVAPWQYPDGVNQPSGKPTSHLDRRYTLHENAVLKLSISACVGEWGEPSVALDSNFGFQGSIPYVPLGDNLHNLDHFVSDYGKNMAGKPFVVGAELLWEVTSFSYNTGESPSYLNQTATLAASPDIGSLQLTFTPLPE